ncbi:hypothetical protein PF010_g19750 [Phytophthora fragariae]|nr:hypothetical protein PF010_g19750 [Phytophthora fragariae]
MLLGDSLGRKYPPYLVLKVTSSKIAATRAENYAKRHSFGRLLWKKLSPLQARNNVVIYGNSSGCWNKGLKIDCVYQPADVAWNRPLKTRLQTRWIEYLEQQMADHEASVADGKTFKMIEPSQNDVAEWVASAWGDLTADTIANGFKRVLKESSEEDDEVALLQIDCVVERLDNLGLLDKEVGEVAEDQDYVDRVVNSIEYADV